MPPEVLTVAGYGVEIHTKDKPNYKVIFGTSRTDELLGKLVRDKMAIETDAFNIECLNDDVYDALVDTSAR